MHRYVFYYIVLFSFLFGCKNSENKEDDTSIEQYLTINFSKLLNSDSLIKLSDIAVDIEMIKLETADDIFIDRLRDIEITDDYLFISDFKNLYQFSRSGEFIRKIGNRGRGPREYTYIVSLNINEDTKEIYIYCDISKKLLVYNFEGRFSHFFKLPAMADIEYVKDSLFLAYSKVIEGTEEHIFYLTNPDSDTIPLVKNNFKWEHKAKFYIGVFGKLTPFYEFNRYIFFKDVYNDTVYRMDRDSLIYEPAYIIDLGKYDMPDEKRLSYVADASQFKKYWDDYYQISIKETYKYLWFQYCTYNYNNPQVQYGLYNKRAGNIFTLIDEDNNKSQIINDFTGGPKFWPVQTEDNMLIDFIYPYELKAYFNEKVNNKDIESNKYKYPLKRKKLKEIAFQSSESDNPIIIIAFQN